jgi:hypothetical protein
MTTLCPLMIRESLVLWSSLSLSVRQNKTHRDFSNQQ